MTFKSGAKSAISDFFGEAILEFLFELPGTLLSECDGLEGLVVIGVFILFLCGIGVVLIGLVTIVTEVFSSGGLQQLGLK